LTLCFGVGAVVDALEVCEGDLGVFLSGGQAGVAEEFLDGTEICTVTEEVGGVSVAEAMWVDS